MREFTWSSQFARVMLVHDELGEMRMAERLAFIEARLNRLETEIRELRKASGVKEPKPWYEQILGTFDNDPGFEEMVRLGKEIRDADQGINTARRKRKPAKRSSGTSSKKGRG